MTKHMKIDEYAVLSCPYCGNDNLHQKQVEVFAREEDEVAKHSVLPLKGTNVVQLTRLENPSGRRQGLLILFECEHCSDTPKRGFLILEIYQRKGCTYIGWM